MRVCAGVGERRTPPAPGAAGLRTSPSTGGWDVGRWLQLEREDASQLSIVRVWADLVGPTVPMPVIVAGNAEHQFYQARPLLEHVFSWALDPYVIEDLLTSRTLLRRSEIVLAKAPFIKKNLLCIRPQLLPEMVARVDAKLGLLPSPGRMSLAARLVHDMRFYEPGKLIVLINAQKSKCQLKYELHANTLARSF